MTEQIERSEARKRVSEPDGSGLAANPLARRWLKRQLADEMEKAMITRGEERNRHRQRVEEIRAQLGESD